MEAGVVVLVADDHAHELHVLVQLLPVLFLGRLEAEEVLDGEGRVRRRAGEHLRDHVAGAGAAGDGHVGEDGPHARRHVVVAPLRFGRVGQLFVALGRHHAHVRPPGVVVGLEGAVGAEAVPVQDGHVVEVAIAVVGDLPVGAVEVLAAHHPGVVEGEVVEERVVAREEGVDVHAGAGPERDPDHARALGGGQRREAVAGAVEFAEVALVEHAREVALEVVGPGVVVAAEDARVARLRLLHHVVAAVAAHVDEGAGHAVVGARDEHGHARHLDGAVGARLAQLRGEGEGQRQPPEDAVHLDLPAVGIVVVGGGDPVDGGREVDALVLQVLHLAAAHFHQLLSRHAYTLPRAAPVAGGGSPARIRAARRAR